MKRLASTLAWGAIAALGAAAFGVLALSRGESINAAWLLIAALCSYSIGSPMKSVKTRIRYSFESFCRVRVVSSAGGSERPRPARYRGSCGRLRSQCGTRLAAPRSGSTAAASLSIGANSYRPRQRCHPYEPRRSHDGSMH